MRDDQRIRGLALLVVGGVYVARLLVVGNGTISAVGYDLNPFALSIAAVIMLALPETIEMLPFGPSRQSS